MDSYESDNHAYEHMRKHGIHRQKKNGEWKYETVGGKPFPKKYLESNRMNPKARAKALAIRAETKGPSYHKKLAGMYGGKHKIPLEAVKRAAEGKGRSSNAYSKFLEKNK